MNFEELFISEGFPYQGKSQRDKFLSRVFGIFSEKIVRIWCRNQNSPFEDLGRPTIYDENGKHYTLDFLLKDSESNVYLTEMKCEIEYQKYKNLTLGDPKQLKGHQKKRAFQLFLEAASQPETYEVKCGGEKVAVQGSALIWGRTSDENLQTIKSEFSLAHILSTEQIVSDLIIWEDEAYESFISQYEDWSEQLFRGLLGKT